MSRARIVDHYLSKINNKDFTILDVRQELEKNNVDDEEIRVIVRLVDNEIQRRLRDQSINESGSPIILTGAVITIVGLAITIGTYSGFIHMGGYFLLAYGPILGGLSILFYGLGKRRTT